MVSKWLEGDDEYSWGHGDSPPTAKQERAMDLIKRELGVTENILTSSAAYDFIGKYFDKAKEAEIKRKTKLIDLNDLPPIISKNYFNNSI
jgi:hypothetical protein